VSIIKDVTPNLINGRLIKAYDTATGDASAGSNIIRWFFPRAAIPKHVLVYFAKSAGNAYIQPQLNLYDGGVYVAEFAPKVYNTTGSPYGAGAVTKISGYFEIDQDICEGISWRIDPTAAITYSLEVRTENGATEVIRYTLLASAVPVAVDLQKKVDLYSSIPGSVSPVTPGATYESLPTRVVRPLITRAPVAAPAKNVSLASLAKFQGRFKAGFRRK